MNAVRSALFDPVKDCFLCKPELSEPLFPRVPMAHGLLAA